MGSLIAATLATSATAPRIPFPADAVPTATEVVLLTNDNALPLVPDAALAVVTAIPSQSPAARTDPVPHLAEYLSADVVVDLGPALPATLDGPPPVPAEVFSAADGRPGLVAEYFGREDFTQPLLERREPWMVQDGTAHAEAVAVRWSGVLTPPSDGRYELTLAATGGSRLFVEGVEVAATVPVEVDDADASAAPDGAAGTPDAVPPLGGAAVELNLLAGQAVDVVVEHVDPGDCPLAALGWWTPEDVVPSAVTQAVEAAAGADVTVIHVPDAPRHSASTDSAPTDSAPTDQAATAGDASTGDASTADAPARGGRLPVDHAELVRRVVDANPRTVVILDAAADPSLAAWVDGPAAVLHAGAASTEVLSEVLTGRIQPGAALAEPIWPPPADDAGTEGAVAGSAVGDDEREPLFPAGFGHAYWSYDVESLDVFLTEGAVTATVEVTARGTATGRTQVHVLAEPEGGGEPVTVGVADVVLAPHETATARVDVDLGALGTVTWPLTLHAGTAPDVLSARTQLAGPPAETPRGEDGPATDGAGAGGDEATAEPVPGTTQGPAATADDAPTPLRAAERQGVQHPPAEVDPSRPGGSAGIDVTGRIPEHAPQGLHVTVTEGAALGEAELVGDRWRLSGNLPRVTVVDNREHDAAEAGWTVSARMTDLDGAAGTVPAASVGWTPALLDAAAGVLAGPHVATELSGGPGLGQPAVLGRAAGEARRGPARLGADLVLETPLGTAPGSYAGTMTITIFPNEHED